MSSAPQFVKINWRDQSVSIEFQWIDAKKKERPLIIFSTQKSFVTRLTRVGLFTQDLGMVDRVTMNLAPLGRLISCTNKPLRYYQHS